MNQTVTAPLAVVVPIQARRVPAETTTRLACAVADAGLGASFCYWQQQDTETWQAAGHLLTAWGIS